MLGSITLHRAEPRTTQFWNAEPAITYITAQIDKFPVFSCKPLAGLYHLIIICLVNLNIHRGVVGEGSSGADAPGSEVEVGEK